MWGMCTAAGLVIALTALVTCVCTWVSVQCVLYIYLEPFMVTKFSTVFSGCQLYQVVKINWHFRHQIGPYHQGSDMTKIFHFIQNFHSSVFCVTTLLPSPTLMLPLEHLNQEVGLNMAMFTPSSPLPCLPCARRWGLGCLNLLADHRSWEQICWC